MPCGLPTRKYFQAIWSLEMPCSLPTRRYFQAIWSLKCPAGCRPAGTFKAQVLCLKCPAGQPLGVELPCGLPTDKYFQAIWSWKCLANCQATSTFKPFCASNALRVANPQVLSSHLLLEVPCGLPTRRYFQGIWCLKCPAGCLPEGTFKAFGA